MFCRETRRYQPLSVRVSIWCWLLSEEELHSEAHRSTRSSESIWGKQQYRTGTETAVALVSIFLSGSDSSIYINMVVQEEKKSFRSKSVVCHQVSVWKLDIRQIQVKSLSERVSTIRETEKRVQYDSIEECKISQNVIIFLWVGLPFRIFSSSFYFSFIYQEVRSACSPQIKSFIFPLYIFATPLNNTYTQVYLYIYSALK